MEASNSHRANGTAHHESATTVSRLPASLLPGEQPPGWPTEVVILRAKDRAELIVRIDELQDHIEKHPSWRLADLGFTLNTQLESDGVRLAVVAGDLKELSKKLATAREQLASTDCQRIRDPSGTYYESQPLLRTGKLAVLFPGEGGQYLGMLSDLLPHFPEVREALANADAAVGPDGDDRDATSRFFMPVAQMAPERREFLEQRLRQIDCTMSSVLAADRALTSMLDGLGVKPDALGGHSAGELAALVAAGSIQLATDLPSIGGALRAQGEAERRTEYAEALLLATAASRETLNALIAETVPEAVAPGGEQSVFIAMDNCPHQTVVVGLPEPMTRVEAALKARRIICDRLPFSRPYHTPLFKAFSGPWRETYDAITFHRPSRRLYSCTTAELFPNDPAEIRDLALAHWYSPVEFRRMIENMYADGVRVFVEAGPRGILSAFVQDILRGRDCLALPADQSRRSAITQWNHLVAQLAVHEASMDLNYLYRYRSVERLDWLSSVATQSPTQSAPANAVSSRIPAAPIAAAPTSTPQTVVADPTSANRRAGGPAEVVARHFQLMETMLADQQRVLQDYLRVKSSQGAFASPGKLKVDRRGRQSIPPIARQLAPARGAPPLERSAPPATSPPRGPSPGTITAAPGEFPLFGAIVRHEPGVELVMQRRLDLAEDRYANEHTVGGLDISRLNPQQRGLPVMPMTFILEMMAESAAKLVPGMVVVAARDVQLQKWLAFDEESVSTVEVVARRTPTQPADGTVEVLVSVRDLGRSADANRAAAAAVSQGTIVLAREYPKPTLPERFDLTGEQPCRVTLPTLYRNLFHGPMFQGVRSLDCFGTEGLKAKIEVLPRHGLFRSLAEPRFLIDPVTVDVGMHPTAGWHLEQPDQAGRIMLPFELKRIEFFGPSPAVGEKFGIYARIMQTSPRQFTHAGEFIKSDGSLWCRLTGIKCWRFYLPFGEVNFHGPKDEYFISQHWSPGLPSPEAGEQGRAVSVLLDASGDISQSGMQEAAARITLSDKEMQNFRQQRGAVEDRTAWLFSRVAIKDAVRFLWHRHSGSRLFMADLDILPDHYGRSTIRFRDGTRPPNFPAVAVAQNGLKFAALAVLGPCAGIAIERADVNADQSINQSLDELFDESERAALAQLAKNPAEQLARGLAARSALRQALGPALIPGNELLRIRSADGKTGCLHLEPAASLHDVFPDLVGCPVAVRTVMEEDFVIASTAGPVLGARG